MAKAKTPSSTKLGRRNPDVRLWLFVEQSIWFRIIKEKSARYILTQSSCIYPYLFKEETRSVIMLVNTMFKGFKQIVLEMKGVEFTSVEIVGKDGVIRPVNFEYTDGVLTVKEPLEHLSTATLILK